MSQLLSSARKPHRRFTSYATDRAKDNLQSFMRMPDRKRTSPPAPFLAANSGPLRWLPEGQLLFLPAQGWDSSLKLQTEISKGLEIYRPGKGIPAGEAPG